MYANINDKFEFEVRTARKNSGFQLCRTGELTMTEPCTKKVILESLIECFLEDINQVEGANYQASEVRVKLIRI